MRISSVASAFPKHHYSQEILVPALKRHWGARLKNPEILDRIYLRMGVESRYLSLPLDAYDRITTWGKANNAWIETAKELGQQAICRAVQRAGLELCDLKALFVVSVTGIASPSLDARLVNLMRLDPHIKRVPIFGLGCVAGAAGIARAADYVRAFPDHSAALLSVELCSLTIQREDVSMANIISSGLFGDGAAAVIVSGSEIPSNGPQIVATRSVFYPDTEDVMGWDISEQGFRIVLSPGVPEMAKHLASDVDVFLGDNGLTRADIGCWVLHNGGPKVLEATEAALNVSREDLSASWNCLAKAGNLSSASVLLVLEEIMTEHRPAPGTPSILAAMGPGFCSELVLLRW